MIEYKRLFLLGVVSLITPLQEFLPIVTQPSIFFLKKAKVNTWLIF